MNQTDTAQLEQRIIRIIIGTRNVDPSTVTASTTLNDLDIDSLNALTIAFDIKDEFKIEIPDEELIKLRTVGDVITGVRRLLTEQEGSTHS